MDESYTIQTSKGNNKTKPPNWRSSRNPNPSKDEYTWNDCHYMYHNEFVSYIYEAWNGFLHVQEYVLCILCILCFTANNIFTAMKKSNRTHYNKNKWISLVNIYVGLMFWSLSIHLVCIDYFKNWCMEFDLRHSLVNSLANIMYYYINCTYILFKFTLFKTHFLCLISRLYLSHKIRYATLVWFFYCKKQMTVIGNDIIGNSPMYTWLYTYWLCNNSLEFILYFYYSWFE